MAGLLPGLLPVLSSVPIVGPLLDDDEPTPTRQADDEDARPTPPTTTTTREAGGAERTTSTVAQATAITRLTPLVPGAVEQTTAPTVLSTASDAQATLSISTTASLSQGTSVSAPESSITPQESGGGQGSSMVPAIGITAGVGALFLIIGVILWTRYRRGKWPFARRRFAMLDEPELEKNVDSKWDPSRTPGMSRISRFVSSSRY